MKIVLPKDVEFIIYELNKKGFEAYAVGGCVRDSLLSLCPNDWDICTSALPNDIIECFKDYKPITKAVKHGTVAVKLKGVIYEITTYRTDGTYSDSRHPDSVCFVSSLKEDLRRRDFTINAMAYNNKVKLIDYFGGFKDIENKIIRCVGDCTLRFREDALRILRALRFAAAFNFEIEQNTQKAIYENLSSLRYLSAERIMQEFTKLLLAPGAEKILLKNPLVICEFIPHIKQSIGFKDESLHHIYDIWTHSVKSAVLSRPDPVIRLAMLFHDLAKPFCVNNGAAYDTSSCNHAQLGAKLAEHALKKLKYDSKTVNTVCDLISYHNVQITDDIICVKRWLSMLGINKFKLLIEVKISDAKAQNPEFVNEKLKTYDNIRLCLDNIIENKLCFSLKDLAVDGNDLISLGYSEGVEIGKILNRLLNLVIEEKVQNEKQHLLQLARQFLKK